MFPLVLEVPGTSRTFHERKDILFVGGFQHQPNVDAVKFFVAEVMPELRRECSGVKFLAAGSNAPEDIKALACDDVEILGFVDDLHALMDRVVLSVAPLRYGAGIKGKIGTSLAAGLPVVSTTIGVEGMNLKAGIDVLVADDVEEFVKAIKLLMQDEELWNNVSESGLATAESLWGNTASKKLLGDILQTLNLPS